MLSTLRRPLALSMCGALAILAACSGTSEPAADVTPAPTASASTTAAPVATTTPTTRAAASTSRPATTTTSPAATTAPAPAAASGASTLVVDSTAEQYFVLYLKPVLAAAYEVPVAVTKGQAGKTTLTDGRSTLPTEHYRVDTRSVAAPGDVDGDGIDDLTELADPLGNPLNPAPKMDAGTGAILVPDRDTYSELSYQGANVGRDSYLAGLEVMKFLIVGTNTAHPSVYFMNTNTYNAHPVFASAVGIPGIRGGPTAGVMRGDVVYEPERVAADGTKGVYRFAFQPNDAFAFRDIALAYELLTTNMPFLEGHLSYYAFASAAYPLYLKEKALYDAYRVNVIKADA